MCSELFRIPIDILTGRSQWFSAEDRGQGHKWSYSCGTCNTLSLPLPQVSSQQAGGGSDPAEREYTSDIQGECCELTVVFLHSIEVPFKWKF